DTAHVYRVEPEVGQVINQKIREGVIKRGDIFVTTKAVLAKGLTKGIGVSNFTLDQMKRLLANCKVPPAINQIEINLNLGQTELVEYCQANHVLVTAYTPLGTMIESRAVADSPEPKLNNPTMVAIAKKHGKTVSQVTFRYLYQRGLAMIPKTITKARVLENASIFDFQLDAADVATLAKFDVGYRTLRLVYYQDMENYPFDKIPGKVDVPLSMRRWKN
ncbi:Uncharacterized protein OBRU01_21790, partial [Operophtera brumata]